jgi:hypothetical protein
MQHPIRNRHTGAVQFTAEIDCDKDAPGGVRVGLAVLWAIKTDADLRGADLGGANMCDANLLGADLGRTSLIDGGQRVDGYRLVGWVKDGNLMIRAGCRDLTIEEAREHWGSRTYRDAALGAESLAILDRIETTARIRKLITEGDDDA